MEKRGRRMRWVRITDRFRNGMERGELTYEVVDSWWHDAGT